MHAPTMGIVLCYGDVGDRKGRPYAGVVGKEMSFRARGSESRNLRTWLTFQVESVRRSLRALCLVGMTNLVDYTVLFLGRLSTESGRGTAPPLRSAGFCCCGRPGVQCTPLRWGLYYVMGMWATARVAPTRGLLGKELSFRGSGASRGIYAFGSHFRSNRCEDPSTRFACSG